LHRFVRSLLKAQKPWILDNSKTRIVVTFFFLGVKKITFEYPSWDNLCGPSLDCTANLQLIKRQTCVTFILLWFRVGVGALKKPSIPPPPRMKCILDSYFYSYWYLLKNYAYGIKCYSTKKSKKVWISLYWQIDHDFNGFTLFLVVILLIIPCSARTTVVHLNIWAGPTYVVLVWTVPPLYIYKSGRPDAAGMGLW